MVRNIPPAHSFKFDGAAINVYHASKGEGLMQHEHTYDHLTVCHAGSLIVRKEGRELVMTKDTQPVNLVANEWHELEALKDDTVFVNVFPDGEY